MPADPEELKLLLSNTGALLNQVYHFVQTVEKPQASSHRGVSIKYTDLKERRDDFIRELKSTVISWVYSKQKYQELFNDLLRDRNNDVQNTHAYLSEIIKHKFRKGHPQGQFGELLLFNFIQFFFSAPPLLRKMAITTNPGIERHGADAIHYNSDGKNDLFILGESKCYESKYQFNHALENSVKSIIGSFNKITEELILYAYDDMIDPNLVEIAKNLQEGKSENPRFELVCLVAYNETKSIDADSAERIQCNIQKCLIERWANASELLYQGIQMSLIKRIHYVVFPIWKLDELLKNFED